MINAADLRVDEVCLVCIDRNNATGVGSSSTLSLTEKSSTSKSFPFTVSKNIGRCLSGLGLWRTLNS